MDDDGNKIVGFMDIGTNSIHLLVVKFVPGTTGLEIAQDREVIRLGRSLYSEGTIDQEAIEKARIVADRFTKYAKTHGADEVIAFATCAAREANNREELIEALQSDGLEVRVIPGEEEARLIRLGVLGIEGPRENTLLLDIGGGSTELSLSNGREIIYLDSMPMGAVRYAYGYPYDPLKPLSYDEYASYQHHVDLYSYRSVRKVKEIGFKNVIGSSGTFEALAEICAVSRDGDNSYLTYDEVHQLMKRMRVMTTQERSKIPKLNPSRLDIILAGGAIAEELMLLFGIEKMKISRFGLKEGMKVDYLLSHGVVNVDVRESSVKSLAYRCQYNVTHAEHVRSDAEAIFDRMKELRMHFMTDNTRSLLGYAALLHDIGEFFSYNKHHINSFNIIVNSNMLGFSYKEIAAIALMTRYHHKKFPSANDPLFAEYGITDPSDIRQCILILRIADALDRHHTQSVENVKMSLSGDRFTMDLSSEEDIRMEIWKLNEYKGDFKNIFGKELVVTSEQKETDE